MPSPPSLPSRLARWLGRLGLAAAALAATAALPACAAEPDAGGTGEDDYTRKKGKLQLLVTVDWEGRELREDNLQAMEALRARFPEVKIVHFLNAAYYNKPGADRADVTARINRVLLPGDERGLHIHGWKRLFEAAGASFVSSPTFWGTSVDPMGRDCATRDCGHEVPISNYTTDELRKVVRYSLDTLEDNGFGRAKSFRCGGWMAKQSVRDALAAEGITYDHSAVPAAFLAPKLASYPVHGWLAELWQGTTPTSQPYELPAFADGASRDLVEVPDNGALADYVTAAQMVEVFHQNRDAFLRDKKKNVVVSIGFHTETASTYLPQIESALTAILEEAKADRLPLESVTSSSLTPR